MILVNLYGGPCAGKTTMAHAVMVLLKRAGIRVEFTGEVARNFIYKGQTDQFDNQYYVSAKQYSLIRNLERHNCFVALSDSPLRQQLVYAKDVPYVNELRAITEVIERPYDVISVWVERRDDKPYDSFGRNQKKAEDAYAIDGDIMAVMPEPDVVVKSNPEGDKQLFDYIMNHISTKYITSVVDHTGYKRIWHLK